jgi:hypothetical protein
MLVSGFVCLWMEVYKYVCPVSSGGDYFYLYRVMPFYRIVSGAHRTHRRASRRYKPPWFVAVLPGQVNLGHNHEHIHVPCCHHNVSSGILPSEVETAWLNTILIMLLVIRVLWLLCQFKKVVGHVSRWVERGWGSKELQAVTQASKRDGDQC